jgi:hypothetical protein
MEGKTDTHTRTSLSFQEEQDLRCKASDAFEYRLYKYEEDVTENRYFDGEEATYGYYIQDKLYQDQLLIKNKLSYFENWCIEANWNGDTNINRFWFYSNISDIDKTNSLRSNTNIDHTTLEDSSYYTLSKSAYQEITVSLTPEATEREYGRVFFSTETRYTLEHNPDQQPYRDTVRGYSIYKNRKVYCTKYINPYKGVLFHKNENGSIIRRPTHRGDLINRFYNHIESFRFAHTNIPTIYRGPQFKRYKIRPEVPLNPPYGPPRQGYVAEKLYHEITQLGLQHDYETWALKHCNFTYHYYQQYQQYPVIIIDDEQISHVLKKQILCRNWVKKIQRAYRLYGRKKRSNSSTRTTSDVDVIY